LPERRFLFLLCINDYLFVPENFDHLRIFRGIGFEPFPVIICPSNIPALCLCALNLIVLNGGNEIRIFFIKCGLARFGKEKFVKEDHNDADNCPED
jgi:hypothetical protein